MASQRDIRKLCKSLVARRPDLICVNRYLLFAPLRSFLTGLFFDRRSDRDRLEPRLIAKALCCLQPEFPYTNELPFMRPGYRTWGESDSYWQTQPKERRDAIRPEPWLMSDPDYPEAIRAAIEKEMLPQVAELATWKKVFEFETRNQERGTADYAQVALPYVLAFGDFARAKKILDVSWLRKVIVRHFNNARAGLGDRLAEQGDKLSIDDKRSLIAILHEREAAAIHAMKLEKYWHPTPFPVEEQGLIW